MLTKKVKSEEYTNQKEVADNKDPNDEIGFTKPKKTKNCPFLVLNVIFSLAFEDRLGRLGHSVHKDVLTEGKGRHNETFDIC